MSKQTQKTQAMMQDDYSDLVQLSQEPVNEAITIHIDPCEDPTKQIIAAVNKVRRNQGTPLINQNDTPKEAKTANSIRDQVLAALKKVAKDPDNIIDPDEVPEEDEPKEAKPSKELRETIDKLIEETNDPDFLLEPPGDRFDQIDYAFLDALNEAQKWNLELRQKQADLAQWEKTLESQRKALSDWGKVI